MINGFYGSSDRIAPAIRLLALMYRPLYTLDLTQFMIPCVNTLVYVKAFALKLLNALFNPSSTRQKGKSVNLIAARDTE